jgi:proteic killer suppression protein
VIRSFIDAETRRIYEGIASRRLPSEIQSTARRKLFYLSDAKTLQDLLAPPGNRLEKLSGDREGQYSIRINEQWRICFKWVNNGAEDVTIVDYHK